MRSSLVPMVATTAGLILCSEFKGEPVSWCDKVLLWYRSELMPGCCCQRSWDDMIFWLCAETHDMALYIGPKPAYPKSAIAVQWWQHIFLPAGIATPPAVSTVAPEEWLQ